MPYIGNQPFGKTVRTVTTETITSVKTDYYPNGGYMAGYVDVYVNGVRLSESLDFTATDGSLVTLLYSPSIGDTVEIVTYGSVEIANAVRRSGDTFSGNVYVGSNVYLSTSTISVGNATVNTQITAGNLALNGSTLTIGNSTVNTVFTADTVTVGGTLSLGNTAITGTANVTTAINVGANVSINTTSIRVGNSTVNTYIVSDTIYGPSTLYIDPAAAGDNTGLVIVKGDLQVDGTTFTINSANVTVNDKNVVLASGAINNAATDGAGLTIYGTDANLTYNATGNNFEMSRGLSITGTANVSVGLNVGANVNLSTSQINVGNSTVNTAITSTTITSTALLSIGNTNVTGTANVSTGINVGANVSANTTALRVGNSTVNTVISAASLTTTSNTVSLGTAAYFLANGNVGIGTSSPAYKLQANGTLDIISVTGVTNAFYRSSVSPSGTVNGDWSFGADNGIGTNSFMIYDRINSAYRFAIANSGNVGIGLTNPSYKLDVTGTAHVSSYAYLDSLVSGYIPHTGVTGWGATVGGAQSIAKLKWGSYGRLQHTSYGNIPFLSFNAELYESDYSGSGSGQSSRNYFRPDYNLGQYAIISGSNGGVAFNTGNWSSNNSIDLGAIGDHASYAGGVLANGNWEFKKNIAVGGATPTTSGSGITFPAVQSASTNANTLDDYEEGTFSTSMNLKFGGANVGMVYGDRKAQYVKIGKMVLINLYIYLTTKGSSTGHASIEGFPFGTATDVDFFIPLGVRGNVNSGGNQVSLYSSSAGSTTFPLYQCNLTGSPNAQLFETAFNNGAELNFNFWYYTNS